MAPPSRVAAVVPVAKCEYSQGLPVPKFNAPILRIFWTQGGKTTGGGWKLRLMLKVLYTGCLSLSLAISAQFTLEMCEKNRQKKSISTFTLVLKVIAFGANQKPV